MASSLDRAALRTRVRNRGEWRAPAFPDTFLNDCLDDGWAALYDLIVEQDDTRYLSRATFAVSAGTGEYTITSQATDFYTSLGVELDDSSIPSGWRSLERFDWDERNDDVPQSGKYSTRYHIRGGLIILLPEPTWSGSLRLNYIPAATAFADDNATIDTINRWSEWLVLDCAIKCAMREGTSIKPYLEMRDRVEERIRGASVQDRGAPLRVVDAYGGRRQRYWRRRGGDGGGGVL